MKLHSKLTLIFLLALFIRLLPYPNVFKGGAIFFDGPDAYFHMKRVLLTVRYFPNVPTFDPYTNYPYGGQIIWPPLFDFFIALIAKGVGLGNPSQYLTEAVGALVPPVVGALTPFFVYQLAREIFNPTVGLYSALFLAILPAHVTISTVGMTDQHLAEVFCSTFTFAALLRLISRTKQPGRVGEWESGGYSLGVGMAGCILAWQGSVVFIGFITLYLLALLGRRGVQGEREEEKLSLPFRRVSLPFADPLLRKVTRAYGLALIIIGSVTYWNLRDPVRSAALTYVSFSWFHFLFTLLCLVLILLLAVIGYPSKMRDGTFKTTGREPRTAPVIGFLSLSLVLLLLFLGTPILKGALYLANRPPETVLRENQVILSSSKAWVQTIAEYKPLFFVEGPFDTSYAERSLSKIFYFIPFFWLYVILKATRPGSPKEPYKLFFLGLWTLLSGFMAVFQHRYTYLFSVPCAIYLGLLVERSLTLAQKCSRQRVAGKVFSPLLSTACGFLPPLVLIWILFPSLQYLAELSKLPVGPPQDIYQTLLRLKHLTPEPGDFYSLREQPQYGVLANWSFGRWINYIGHRPAIADNDGYGFQESTQFFLAEEEGLSNRILTERKGRYVLVYDLLQALPHYATILGLDPAAYFEEQTLSSEAGKTLVRTPKEKFYSLMQTRLYEFDGSAIRRETLIPALEHYRLLYESDSLLSEGRPRPVRWVKVFEYVAGASILGKTRPGVPVTLLLNVQTNQQRIFPYWNAVLSDAEGNFKFTVPYPTDGSLASVRTSEFYLLKCGTDFERVQVDAEAVYQGKEIVLKRSCE